MNLKALQLLFPKLQASAIEINKHAVSKLQQIIPKENIFHNSILEWDAATQWDLTLIKGVLIHINPDELPRVYDKLVQSSRKYLLVVEYYNPTPITVTYRGYNDRLFKRDFAGEIMARYPKLKLLDYGFVYHGDKIFPQDDTTWFLLEK